MSETNKFFRGGLLAALDYPTLVTPTHTKLANLLIGMPCSRGLQQPNPPLATASFLGALSPPPSTNKLLAALMEANKSDRLRSLFADDYRSRASWNQRFAHWAKSESTTESQSIERARNMVQNVLEKNTYLKNQGACIEQQGSFTNCTNTRNDSDIDLRIQHPFIKIEYSSGINTASAYQSIAYSPVAERLEDVAMRMRAEIATDLMEYFGRDNVRAGKKAIKVRGINGSRSEVDVVPAFHFNFIQASGGFVPYSKLEGVAIWDMNNAWTHNFPLQHAANGKAKRFATNLQFKRIVRILKRLRADMDERRIYSASTPSFLCECLVYIVEDRYFISPNDDMFGRVKRVLSRALEQMMHGSAVNMLREVNDIKPLFGAGQAWTIDSAKAFLSAALLHLGNA
jgi:hypothetical protein